jgi:L-ornithine N5-oxygenase
LDVELDYRVRLAGDGRTTHAPLYLNGLCESSHGMGDAGSFSLLSLRSAAILNSLSNRLSPASAAGGHTSVPARQPAVDKFQAIA